MFNKILVCLDGSRFSGKALPYAIETAKRFQSELMLLQVVRPAPISVVPATPESGVSSTTVQIIAEAAQQQDKKNTAIAQRYLRRKLRTIKAQDIKGSYHVLIGEPASTILEFCRQNEIDLVVMTTTGKGGIKRAILGSTTDVIIRAPGFPVLAIRPRE